MLSTETKEIVKSTVPLLKEHGVAITTHFYNKMLTKHPELKNVFNQANQAQKTQAASLAGSVLAYAENIDNLEALLPAVQRIAHKHASLGVVPDQYAIVGSNLLESIKEVLDLPEDHAALTAWGEAYGVLAKIFIDAEEAIYKSNEEAEGGWRGFREFVIANKTQQTPEITELELKPADGGAVKAYAGGQYIGLKVKPADSEYDCIRQYSLCGAIKNGSYTIAVKAETEGVDGVVSNHLHSLPVGATVHLQPPVGSFVLDVNAKHHVFISGGVGITPLMGMLREMAQQKVASQDATFIQCCKSAGHEVFKSNIAALQSGLDVEYKVCYELEQGGDHQGLLNAEVLKAWIGDKVQTDTAVYFCGSKPFMAAMQQALLAIGFDASQIHHEIFGPTVIL